MLPALSQPYNLSIRQAFSALPLNAGLPTHSTPVNWAELVNPLLSAIDMYVRLIVRSEVQALSDEMATAVATAEQHEQVLTVQQAADVLGMRPQTVYEWIKAGKLSSFTIGSRSVRLKRGDVLSALQTHSQPDGRRKYARRINGAAKQKRSSVLGNSLSGKGVVYA
jgi:excisionase family DNA binding protein